MYKVLAAVLVAGVALGTTAAYAENPGQFQEAKIAKALVNSETTDRAETKSSNPVSAVISFGSDAISSLGKKDGKGAHSGGDRYSPPRGAFGGPDR